MLFGGFEDGSLEKKRHLDNQTTYLSSTEGAQQHVEEPLMATTVAACPWVTSWSSISTSQPTRFHWLHDLISTSLYIEIASNQDKCCFSTASQCLHQKMLPPLCSTHSTLLMWQSAERPLLFLHTLILRSNCREETHS